MIPTCKQIFITFSFVLSGFTFQGQELVIYGKLNLHPHGEYSGKRAQNFQILIREDSVMIAKSKTDSNGNFSISIPAESHIRHSEIKEPDLDIFYIPERNNQDTVLAKSLTHIDGGNVMLQLHAYRRGIVPEDNGMIRCLKCRRSDMVIETRHDMRFRNTYAFFYCIRDKIKF